MKPASMLINEFKVNVEAAISNSELPPVVLEPIIYSYWLQLKDLSREQILTDTAKYSEEQKKDKKKEDK